MRMNNEHKRVVTMSLIYELKIAVRGHTWYSNSEHAQCTCYKYYSDSISEHLSSFNKIIK